MSNAIERAAKALGGQANLARALQVAAPTVNQWVKGIRPIPAGKCVGIEQATHGEVRRWDLRPDDWHVIWPELIESDGAPLVPAAPAAPSPDAGTAAPQSA